MTLVLVLGAAYLLGSIPTSYIVVYLTTGRDIRTIGTGVAGTMNVLDHVGTWPAIVVGLADVAKGAAAVGIAYRTGLTDSAAIAAGLLAVAGHDWSIFLRFDGGNGMAAAVGAIAALTPIPMLFGLVLATGVWVVVRSRRIAGLTGLAATPLFAHWLHTGDMRLLGVILLITLAVLKIIRSEGFSPARPTR